MEKSTVNGLKDWKPAVAGGISGFFTRFFCQPLDVIKIRFQLQVEPIARESLSKYQSIPQAFFRITTEEGILALWKGHVPAQLLSVTYGPAQFYSYHVFETFLNKLQLCEEWRYAVKFVAGAGAGTVATVVSFPFDTMRTRLVAQSTNNQIYRGILHCFTCLFMESPRTFFYGLLPTVMQIAPHTGLQFAFYNLFVDIYKKCSKDVNVTFLNSMISGSVSGLLAKTVVYPLDLSRKRLQIQGFEHGRTGFGKFFKCSSFFDCVRLTTKQEGLQGLFKGLLPSQAKAAITTALHFTIYEQSLKFLNTLH